MEVDKAETEAEPASASSNEESDDDADADADVEESPRGRKSVSSIIAEMAIKNEQEAASSSARTQKEDELKRMELSNLSPAAMAAYIRELEAELYELSQREARELSRSKHLRIFGNTRRRSSK
ncbi:uncharacterized protein wuc [Drosophila montana]|uniref:uncharacterized protein wuc n=1 Tax=Drosophila montana TaxID=40370 RepID=UPI00313B9A04